MPQKPGTCEMDTKEKTLFREAIKFYENKQYKRGLKNCEQILKKYPDNGESLALKGLFTLYLGKREEGFEICKNGLKLSLQSHVSWHVLGLMHRYDKNYEEAIKCYKSALRIDKENFQILRDLALLQLQCRQFEGVIETRKKILLSRPTAPFNWISIVIAYHMSGNLNQALDALDGYLELFKDVSDPDQDHLYYKVSIMEEMGMFSEAIAFMKHNMKRQSTRRFIEKIAQLYLGAGNFDSCENSARKLLNINPDCREYVQLLLKCYQRQEKSILPLFEEITVKSLLAAVEFLENFDGEEFGQFAPKLLEGLLAKGSPAVFSLFKRYFTDSDRSQVIWNSISVLLEKEDFKEAALVFAANFKSSIGKQDEALTYADQLLRFQPEQKDHLLLKARILKRSNQPREAVSLLEPKIDSFLKDKFSASKVAKYQLRNGSIAKGQEIIASFIQKSTLQEKIGDLHEMQATWYLIEMADRLLKEGKHLEAACFYRKIEMIFEEFIDDQLDFHGFSIRKMSFVDYIKFMKFLDSDLKKSVFLKRALIGQANVFMLASYQTDLTASFASLNVDSTEIDFADDISAVRSQLSTLMSSSKSVDDNLKKICHALLNHHSDSIEALECCFKISMKLGCKLLAQKIASQLKGLSESIAKDATDFISSGRDSDIWANISLAVEIN